MHTLLGFPHAFGRLGAAVVKAAEPVVPRNLYIAVITFEIPVMQLVVERPDLKVRFVSQHQVFKSGMSGGGRQHLPEAQKDEMDRMGGNDKKNQEHTHVADMFDRMHGKARPRRD